MERPLRIPQTLAEWVEQFWTGTQVELAEHLEITQGHLSHLISGKRLPSGRLAIRISKLTGLSERALIQPPEAEATPDAAA